MQVTYAIVFVSDMDHAVAFYRDVMGMPLRFQSPGWTEFDTGAATLALHATRISDPEESELVPGRCRPGLNVPDLDAFHQRMLEHNVRCVQAPKDVFGSRIAQYVDPDGLVISVSEARADR